MAIFTVRLPIAMSLWRKTLSILSGCMIAISLAFTANTFAAAPSDENYDDNGSQTISNQNTFTLDGVKYTIAGSGTFSHSITNNASFSSLGNNGSDYFLLLDTGGLGATSITIEASDGSSFQLSSISFDAIADTTIAITPYNGASAGTAVSYNSNGSYVLQQNVDLSGNSNFQNITKFVFSGSNLYVSLDDLNFSTAVSPTPTVSDSNISITSSGSGTGGAYKIGDTVTVSWNNTAGGDNNSGITSVTADFSAFGGGSSVSASNSSETWTASYLISSGSIDGSNRNVSITANNSSGNSTTADTSNLTVDNIAPTLTDANISISGASGTSGAYKVGDTVTATWNNTAGGDNNSDTISSVTVDFSAFGGGSTVAASNSSSTWTATYTIVSGAIDATSRNISVTATDNAGNTTTTADSSNATVDNIAPTLTDAKISISGGSGTAGAYIVGDTVTATWDNTGSGDNNSDTISSVTVDFSQFGGGSSVSASNSSGTWTATYTIVSGSISTSNRNVSVTTTDNAGNTTTTADTTNASVDNIIPSVSSSVVSGSPAATDTSVSFTVSFSETVSNLSTDDFAVGTTSTASGSISSVSSSSGSSVTVTVGSITGNGTIKVNVNGSSNIADTAGNTGVAAYSSGSTHTVAIPTAPDAPTIGSATAGDGQASVSFTAPASDGGASITGYTVTSNPGGFTGTGSSSPISVTGLSNGTSYTFTVTATNSVGTSSASSATSAVTPKANQAITFTNPGAQNFGTSPTLSATSDSGLTVSFSSSTTGVCTVSGTTLTFVTAGTCTIDADQAGDGSTNAATTVSRSFTVNAVVPGAPTIGSASAGDQQAAVSFSAPASTGGASITGYTVTSSPGGLTGTGSSSPISVTGLTNGTSYSFTVTATNSAGTGSASASSNSVTPIASQTITFTNPGSQTFGTTPSLSATASSGLTVSFSSSTTSVCTVTSGGALTFVSAGSCTIDADQSGSAAWSAATTVSQTFTVNAVAPDAPTIGSATAGDAQASVTFSAPSSSGGAAISSYTVTSSPDGRTASGASSPLTVTGLTNGTSYTFSVTATNSAGTSSGSSASNSVTPLAAQTITFSNPGSQDFGTSPTLSASASSGLTVAFSSATTSVCTITSGGALSTVSVGTCTINADQSGSGSYSAASQVSQSFSIVAVVPDAPTSASATAGDQQASISFTAPSFIGGASILDYTVTSSPGGLTATASSSPITVTGLTNGTSYTFTVKARNSAGSSSSSSASNAISPNAAPTISGTPATTVAQDAAYSFTPTANDDVGDTLTFSISNQPSWASFSTSTGALTGTPGNSDVGSTSNIVISVNDGTVSTSLTAFSITVTNVNDAPTISGTPATSVAQDAAYSFTPTAADIDTGDSLTFSISNQPSWASFSTSTGALTGTPGNSDVGSTSNIVISVNDGTVSTSLTTFSITVTNVNDAPTISGSPATSVAQDAAYSFTPTAADIDTGDSLTFSITNPPSWASFSTSTGALTGTPGNSDVGSTSNIVISVNDGTVSTSLTAFSITVTNVNDAPTISGTPATSVAQDAAYSFTPTAADIDTGDSLTFSITNQPSWASFSTSTGALTGTPGNSDVGSTSNIVISVNDGTVSTSLTAFSITVTNVNDAPTISGSPATSVAQDAAYSFTPTAADIDTGDSLTFSITNPPSWASFSTSTGALTGTPGNSDVGSTSNIQISVSDGTVSTSLTAFSITVTNVNDAPTISGTPATSVAQDAAYSFTPTAADIDTGDSLTFSITNPPSWASFSTSTGALTGTPGNSDVGSYASIQISVSDGTVSTSLTAFSITVTNVNDAPTISGSPATSVAQDAAYSFTPTAADIDTGDSLTFSITNQPSWASFSTSTGALSGTPGNSDVGSTSNIVISVNDGTVSTSLTAFSITVTNVNDAPTISGSPATSVAQDAAYSFTPTAADIDTGDSLTFSITNQPSWASFSTSTGALTGTPGNSDVGSYASIQISVSDGTVSTNLTAFSITVTNVNDAPTISGTPATTVAQDAAYSFTPTAADIDTGDSLTFSITNQPSWASFSTSTGALTGTPGNSDVGSTSNIVISVNDGTVSTSLTAFSITVTNVNDAPTISGTPATTVAQDVAYSFSPTAADIDTGDSLTFSITNQPSWASFSTSTGALSGTPGNSDVGSTSNIVISVNDGTVSTSLTAFSITVTNVNDAPTISGTPATTVAQDAAYSFTPTAADIDTGDSLTFSITNQPSWASFSTSTGALTGTPGNSDVGSTSNIVISVNDGTVSTSLTAFSITVTNVNDAPTISGTPATTVAQDVAYSFSPTAADIDTGDSLTFSITNQPSWASFSTSTGALTGTPGNSDVGSTSNIVISVNDGTVSTSLTAFSITVTNVNDAPTISGTPATSVAQDAAYSFTPTAADIDTGDSLTFSITNQPSWASFSTSTGALTGTPGNSDVGSTSNIQISVSDGTVSTNLTAFSITVTNVNDAPTISGTPATSVAQDAAYSFTPTAADIDTGDSLTFSITNQPSWASFSTSTGALTGTPGNSDVGSYASIQISVSDGTVSTNLTAFSITVTNVNDAPTISGTPATTVAQDAAYSFTPTAADIDTGDSLTFSITNQPSWASFSTSTGALTGTPGNSDVGSTSNIQISVSDGTVSTNLTAFSITVTNVNDAPTISGTPATSVAQDAAYSFTPTAADIDTGDSLTFSITNPPSWASFSTSTGALTGTPTNDHVGTTSAIVISVSDGTVSTSLAAFDLTVSNVNDAPTISGEPVVQIDMGSAYSFVPSAADIDTDSQLTFSISNKPLWAAFDESTGALTGTPLREHVGVTSDIVISVSDGELSAALPAFNIEVLSTNAAPTAVDDEFSLTMTSNNQYQLDVLANDTDPDDDALTLTAVKADVGTATISDNQVLLQSPANFSGSLMVQYRLTDGEFSATANAKVTITGSNPQAPVVTPPADITVNATGLFTKVKLGVASAVDKDGNRLPTELVNGLPFFRPGAHQLFWQATDKFGVSSIATQTLHVIPLVSLAKPQRVMNNREVSVAVYLNGPAPVYPVTIPYTVLAASTADAADHDLLSGNLVITEGTQGEIRFNVHADLSQQQVKTVHIGLADGVNSGANKQTQVAITAQNIAPTLSLQTSQNKQQRILVGQADGLVTVTAQINDSNGDTVALQWFADSALAATENGIRLSFDPSAIAAGTYKIRAIATDNGTPALSTSSEIYINVIAALPELGSGDSNNNLINDQDEGLGDSNNNGIPDYLDPGYDCHVIPEQLQHSGKFVAEGEASACVRKGQLAANSNSGGIDLSNAPSDDQAQFSAGVFDFIVEALPEPGQSYRIVVPQQQPVPLNAVYRKFRSGSWRNFVVDSNNTVASSAGEAGYCPPPGDSAYQDGLTPGHWCVQLTIEDGGPNDDDGIVNSSIVDPGGVAVVLNGNHLPSAQADSFNVQWNQNHILTVLDNDTDQDQDSLTIFQASAAFGDVSISSDGQALLYSPKTDFVGSDSITYGISDGQGGSSSATVTIEVYYNRAPVVSNSTAQTDDRTAIVIDLTSLASDPDGDTLAISAVSTDHGSVAVVNGLQLRYTPTTGFDGIATINATVSDGQGGNSTLSVTVTVNAYETITVVNRASGGSFGGVLGGLILALAWWRRRGTTKAETHRKVMNSKTTNRRSGVVLKTTQFGTTVFGMTVFGATVFGATVFGTTVLGATALGRTCLGTTLLGAILFSVGAAQASETASSSNNSVWSVDIALGQSQASMSGSDVSGSLADGVTLSDYDRSSHSWQLGVGYQLSNDWQLQLQYLDLGSSSLSLTGDTLEPTAFANSLAKVGPLLATGIKTGLNYRVLAHQAWQLNLGAGVWHWQSDLDSSVVGSSTAQSTEFSGTDGYAAIELGYQFDPQLTLLASWQQLQLDRNHANSWQLGLRFQF